MKTLSQLSTNQKIGAAVITAVILILAVKTYSCKSDQPWQPSYTDTQSEISQSMGDPMHSMRARSDEEFIMNMIPHHQEAVDTSAYVLTRTNNPELRTFLQGVVSVQSQEIAQMKDWHKAWFKTEYEDLRHYMPMMGDMSAYTGQQLDVAYIQGMIIHHEGAVQMAKDILSVTQRAELKTMAQAIIDTQTQEIETMKSWLATTYKDVSLEKQGGMREHRMMR